MGLVKSSKQFYGIGGVCYSSFIGGGERKEHMGKMNEKSTMCLDISYRSYECGHMVYLFVCLF